MGDRSRVDPDFVGAAAKNCSDIVNAPNTTSNCQRQRDASRRTPDHVEQCPATLRARRDIEQNNFVGILLLVTLGQHGRIADVAKIDEACSLHYSATVDVETHDEPPGQHWPPRTNGAPLVLFTSSPSRVSESRTT